MEAMNGNHIKFYRCATIRPENLSLEPLIDLKWHFEPLIPSSTAFRNRQLVLLTPNRIHRSEHPQKFLKGMQATSDPLVYSHPFQDSSEASNHFEIQELYAVFRTFDENEDGKLSIDEIRESMAKMGLKMTEKELASMMTAIDVNGNGFVDLEEFLQLYNMNSDEGFEEHDEESLKRAFRVFDKDRDGYITAHELQKVMFSLGVSGDNMIADCRNMMRGVDIDGDGKLNFMEFKLMMSNEGCLMLCPSMIQV